MEICRCRTAAAVAAAGGSSVLPAAWCFMDDTVPVFGKVIYLSVWRAARSVSAAAQWTLLLGLTAADSQLLNFSDDTQFVLKGEEWPPVRRQPSLINACLRVSTKMTKIKGRDWRNKSQFVQQLSASLHKQLIKLQLRVFSTPTIFFNRKSVVFGPLTTCAAHFLTTITVQVLGCPNSLCQKLVFPPHQSP